MSIEEVENADQAAQAEAQAEEEETAEEMGEQPQMEPEPPAPPAPTVDVIEMAAQALHASRAAVKDAKDMLPAQDDKISALQDQRNDAMLAVTRIDGQITQARGQRNALETRVSEAEETSKEAMRAMVRVLQDHLGEDI